MANNRQCRDQEWFWNALREKRPPNPNGTSELERLLEAVEPSDIRQLSDDAIEELIGEADLRKNRAIWVRTRAKLIAEQGRRANARHDQLVKLGRITIALAGLSVLVGIAALLN